MESGEGHSFKKFQKTPDAEKFTRRPDVSPSYPFRTLFGSCGLKP